MSGRLRWPGLSLHPEKAVCEESRTDHEYDRESELNRHQGVPELSTSRGPTRSATVAKRSEDSGACHSQGRSEREGDASEDRHDEGEGHDTGVRIHGLDSRNAHMVDGAEDGHASISEADPGQASPRGRSGAPTGVAFTIAIAAAASALLRGM